MYFLNVCTLYFCRQLQYNQVYKQKQLLLGWMNEPHRNTQYKCIRKHQYYIGDISHYKLLFFIKPVCLNLEMIHKRVYGYVALPRCRHYQTTQVPSNTALGTALSMCRW